MAAVYLHHGAFIILHGGFFLNLRGGDYNCIIGDVGISGARCCVLDDLEEQLEEVKTSCVVQ